MNVRRLRRGAALATAAALLAAGCGSSSKSAGAPTPGSASASGPGGGSGAATSGGTPATLTKVKLQLQWFTQAQFGGYYAAVDLGYFKQAGLDVSILEGGTDIVPQTVLAQGRADYAVAWVPKALASREQGAGITDVGQVFQRSGTLQVSFKSENITTPANLKGKKVGDWGFGNEYELFAAMTKAGLSPGKDVTLVQQQFDEQALIKHDIDAAQATRYNEYAQLLEAKNPATGKLFQPSDFNVMDWNTVGTSMLQDAVWANTAKLQSDKAYQARTVAFLKAAMQGWVYCRDHAQACRDIVVKHGSKLGASHQLWQMNEINKLVWPSKNGIGIIDAADWARTVSIALTTKNAQGKTVLTKQPQGLAYTNTYAQQALSQLKAQGVDVDGNGFTPLTVTLNPGGS